MVLPNSRQASSAVSSIGSDLLRGPDLDGQALDFSGTIGHGQGHLAGVAALGMINDQ